MKLFRGFRILAWRGLLPSSRTPSRGLAGRHSLVTTLTGDLAGQGDRATLSESAERAHLELRLAGSCEDAWHIADQWHAPVILYDRDIQETEWREAVGILSALPHRPIVILISRVADESLWNELFRIGGFDILRKPLRVDETSRVLALALEYWRSEAWREQMQPSPLVEASNSNGS